MALDRAFPKVYAELRRLAEIRLKSRRGGGTVAPYDLLHEAYLRLSTAEPKGFVGRSEFFALASTVMRGILVDYARRLTAAKRVQPVQTELSAVTHSHSDVLAVHEALDRFAGD